MSAHIHELEQEIGKLRLDKRAAEIMLQRRVQQSDFDSSTKIAALIKEVKRLRVLSKVRRNIL